MKTIQLEWLVGLSVLGLVGCAVDCQFVLSPKSVPYRYSYGLEE